MSRACANIAGDESAGRAARILLWAAAISIGLSALVGSGAVAQRERITLGFQGVAAADAIIQFRWLAEVPVVFEPPAADASVTLTMVEVPLEDALTALCAQMGYQWRKVGELYVLEPAQRTPLLPSPEDLADRFLFPERERLDAARLLLTLTAGQIALAAQGESLRYADLGPTQQDLLGRVYDRLITAARAGWVPGAQGLAGAATTPPDSLAFSIRGYIWGLEQPRQPGAAQAPQGSTPPQPPAPPALEEEQAPPQQPEESPSE